MPVINGYLNIILGPVETDANGVTLPAGDSINDAFTGGIDCYLEVQVDAEPVTVPRQRILTTPYVFLRGKNEARVIGSYEEDAFQGHNHIGGSGA